MASRIRESYASLQARVERLTRELEAARAEQMATRDILRVIARSSTRLQDSLESIAERAARLCGADDAIINLVRGDRLALVAHVGAIPQRPGSTSLPVSRDYLTGRSVIDRKTIHVPDMETTPGDEFVGTKQLRQGAPALPIPRTMLAVPLLTEAVAIGAILIRRLEVRPFTDEQSALLESFADQAVIAISNAELFQQLQDRNRELAAALQQQTATAEVLEVISRSPTDLQKVLDTIADSAARLCETDLAAVLLVQGNTLNAVAGLRSGDRLRFTLANPVPIGSLDRNATAPERAVVDQEIVHIDDLAAVPSDELSAEYPRRSGTRTMLAVPLLRQGVGIGAISLPRREVRPFSQQEIGLVKTFADQAIIAIENARLFQELQERLEEQTATSEILRVISRSPTNLQSVLGTIAEAAAQLCDAPTALIQRLDGDILTNAVGYSTYPEIDQIRAEARSKGFTGVPATPRSQSGRALLERRTIHTLDMAEAVESEYPDSREGQRITRQRTEVVTPLLREGEPIGLLDVLRYEVRPFTDEQIKLLESFADQAAIAISNAELFQQLQDRNRELAAALEQQTATANVLQTISRSAFDLQNVLDTVTESATRMCAADMGFVGRVRGDAWRMDALHYPLVGASPEFTAHAWKLVVRPGRHGALARALLERRPIHIPDILADPDYNMGDIQRTGGYRVVSAIPLMREGELIGAFVLSRTPPEPFTDAQIKLLEMFADQAAIAITNAELFQQLQSRTRELAQSVEQLKGLFEVGQAVSSTLDLGALLDTIAARAVGLSEADGGGIFELDEETQRLHLRTSYRQSSELIEVLRRAPLRVGEGAAGRAAATREPIQIPDATIEGAYQSSVREILIRSGFRALLAVPLLRESQVLGALVLNRNTPGAFAPEIVELVQTFASQSAIALQNARLFQELEEKNRALELAGRHKSQFLANMSHELRTPLNAILGYTELILDGIYGDVPDEIRDVMGRVDASGRHLLGLINSVLDLSKIEAGQLSLSLADYSLAEVVQTALVSVESLAAEKGLALEFAIAPDLPNGRGDERRISQVLLNLVGNAIKFTETGTVRVSASVADGQFVVAVSDTGPGIAAADQERIFEEFQQVDASSTREKGGTGLGLSIARRIVELHGGRVWVESEVGRGATFTFAVPIRVEDR